MTLDPIDRADTLVHAGLARETTGD